MKKRLLTTLLALSLVLGLLPGAGIVPLDGETLHYGALYYRHSEDGIVITDCARLLMIGSVTIPEEIDGTPVKHIGNSAFQGCVRMNSISIPNGVTFIGDYAFDGCSNLTSISIPDSLVSIGTQAFFGCSGLTSVSIPDGATFIGNRAFYKCSNLTSKSL